MLLLLSLVFGLFFFILLAIVLLRANTTARKVNVTAKMRPYLEQSEHPLVHRQQRSLSQFMQTLLNMVQPIGRALVHMPQAGKMDQRMQQADLPFRGADFIVLMGLVGIVTMLLTTLLFRSLGLGIIFGLVAIVICMLWLQMYIQRRRTAFANQLGDALVMMANALRAGFSFNQSMALIGREMNSPISDEFTKTVMEMQLGGATEVAMENMGRRVQSKDFDLVVTAVLIQRQVGGNLSQILDTVANTIMERVRMKREITALTAQGRLSGYVLVCLPVFFVVAMFMISPEFIMPLFTQTLGNIMLGVGIFLDLMGLMVIRKLVNIEM